MNALDEKRNVLLEIADLKVHFDIKDLANSGSGSA
jgi:oligopeptide transport system ATP-binding protein